MPASLPATCRRLLVLGNYYLAALMLLVAGIMKAVAPGVSDLLQALYESGFLSFPAIITISRWQPWLEISLGAVALSGVVMIWSARLMAALYLLFFALILVAARGYLFLPIDCGCFGQGEGTPAYLLLARNAGMAMLLLLVNACHENAALWPRLPRQSRQTPS
ncbi:MauE/DoxX family redox-associated membrane protein [Thiovibrio sp. JS02]